ncbi:hypothetical protein V1281_000695 [Nitrobacteraceae bacterium AZCC 2161]
MAGGIEHPRRDQRAQWPDPRIEAAIRRPRIAHPAPGLGQQHQARQCFDVAERRGDQRGDHRVIVVMLDAQKKFRLGQRPRLGRRRQRTNRSHAVSSMYMC